MGRAKRPDPERRSSTIRIPQSLMAWLMGEISDDEAFEAKPEPSSIISPVGVDGSWDGFDSFVLLNTGGFAALFAQNEGLREELDAMFHHLKRKPPWE